MTEGVIYQINAISNLSKKIDIYEIGNVLNKSKELSDEMCIRNHYTIFDKLKLYSLSMFTLKSIEIIDNIYTTITVERSSCNNWADEMDFHEDYVKPHEYICRTCNNNTLNHFCEECIEDGTVICNNCNIETITNPGMKICAACYSNSKPIPATYCTNCHKKRVQSQETSFCKQCINMFDIETINPITSTNSCVLCNSVSQRYYCENCYKNGLLLCEICEIGIQYPGKSICLSCYSGEPPIIPKRCNKCLVFRVHNNYPFCAFCI